MKKTLIIPILFLVGGMTGCFSKIIPGLNESVEEWVKENGYTDSSSFDDFNKEMAKHIYFWETDTAVGKSADESYISPRSDTIDFYKDNNQITLRSKLGDEFYIYTDEKSFKVAYISEDYPRIYVMNDWSLNYSNNNYLEPLTPELEDVLKYHSYDDGYLFKTYTNFMFYITSDFQTVYLNESDSNKFENQKGSVTLPDSDLLAEGLTAYGKESLFALPAPSGFNNHIYHKERIDEKDNEWEAYEVIIRGQKPTEYVETLKRSGLEVYRGEYFGIIDTLDKKEGGEWVAYDKYHNFKIHISYMHPIAVIFADKTPDNYGVILRVQKAGYTFSHYGTKVKESTDWTDDEKIKMVDTFGITLPFVQLGPNYSVTLRNLRKRPNEENPMMSTLDMDVECWWINDNFYKDIISDTYGDILEEAGFIRYEDGLNENSTVTEINEFKRSDNSKYYDCYINDEYDLAVKFLFDDIYGNTIKVFKKSELIAFQYED